MAGNVSNISGGNFKVNTNLSNFNNNNPTSFTNIKMDMDPTSINNLKRTTNNYSNTMNQSVEEVEEFDLFDEVKDFFSDLKMKIFNREEYKIDQLQCDDASKTELKMDNAIIEELNGQIEELEGQIKYQQNIIDTAQRGSLSVNDPNYNIAGTAYSVTDVESAQKQLGVLNEQLMALKQLKGQASSAYYQLYHVAELQPYDILQSSEFYKNYTLNAQTEEEVKTLVGKDYDYLTEEQYKILNYLYQTEGKSAAKEYYDLLEMDLNNVKGMEEAYNFLDSLPLYLSEDSINKVSEKYKVDTEYLKGLSFTDLMDTSTFLQKALLNYSDFTEKELEEFLQYIQENIAASDWNNEKGIRYALASYLGVSVKALGDGVDTFFNGLLNCFDDGRIMSQNEYASQYILTALSSLNTHLDDSYQIGTSIGNMAIPSLAALGVTAASQGALGAEAAEFMGGLASKVLFFSSTFGNAKHEALLSGSDKKTAYQSAFLNATSEVCLEHFLGTIPGLGSNSNNIIKKLFGEGFEEFIQEYYSAGVDAYLYGTEIDLDQLNANARKSFVYGCLTSYMMNGANNVMNVTIDGVKKTLTSEQIKSAIKEDGTIDYEQLKTIKEDTNNIKNSNTKVQDTNTAMNNNANASNNTAKVNVLENSVSENRLNMEFEKGKDVNGGNQQSYADLLNKVFKTKADKASLAKAESIIKENAPDSSPTDIKNMMQNFNQNGCSYVAAANIILEQTGYNTETLVNIFGENILDTNGNVDANALALDLYSYMDGKYQVEISSYDEIEANSNIEAAEKILGQKFQSEGDANMALWNAGWSSEGTKYTSRKPTSSNIVFESLNDIIYDITGNNQEGLSLDYSLDKLENMTDFMTLQRIANKNGFIISAIKYSAGSKMTSDSNMQSWINNFLSSKGYNIECSDAIQIKSGDLEQYVKDGYSIKVCAKYGSPISMTDGSVLGYTTLGSVEDGSGHAMTLKGIDPDGNLIVSSWGKLFSIDKAYADSLDFTAVKIEGVETAESSNYINEFKNLSDDMKLSNTANIMDKINFFKHNNTTPSVVANQNNNSNIQNNSISNSNYDYVNYINKNIRENGNFTIAVRNSTELTAAMLTQVEDLSKLQVQIMSGFADLNGNFKDKYRSNKYIDRMTYTGYEAYDILRKLDYLESKINKTLPIEARAKQIYEVLAREVPVMRDFLDYQDGHKVAASLRGLTSNNAVGKEGLVCAGYASVYKELCMRCGIDCDYITGTGVSDPLRSNTAGKHAWNVVIDGNREIPVDVTWKASGDMEWFGPSQIFQDTHIAEADEIYKSYNQSYASMPMNNNVNSINNNVIQNQLNSVVASIETKYGQGMGMLKLKEYIETGEINKITRTNGARDIVSNIPNSEIISYINKVEKNNISNVVRVMVDKYGVGETIDRLNILVTDKNYGIITRDGNSRDIMRNVSFDQIENFAESFESIRDTMVEKYGQQLGNKAIEDFLNGELNKITRTNDARNTAIDLFYDK